MTKLSEGLYFIPGQDEFLPDSHIYLLGDPASHDLSLVDAGLVGKGAYKTQSLFEMGIDSKDIRRVIMTHTHLDHIGCLREILQAIPWAEVWMHRSEAEALARGDERTVYGMEMFREMCQIQYTLEPGDFRLQVHRQLEGGEELNLGGMTWEVIHIPGHSMGSIGLYHAPGKVLIPGDVIYADAAIGRFDLHGADGPTLRDSLIRLAGLEVKTLLPGHNQIVRSLPQSYIQETANQWEQQLL